MDIKCFFDKQTFTLTYLVTDPKTKDAIVIDPVLDYEPWASKTDSESVDKLIAAIKEQNLTLRYILETHAHADHLSGAQRLKDVFPKAKHAIGSKITDVQETFKQIFDLPNDFPTDGSQFDQLLDDGEVFQAGSIKIETMHTPGHTPACATYKIDDAIFTGDTLFMPDTGTGRCDFPGGDTRTMYRSVKRLYQLDEATRVFVGHDYQANGRDVAFESTIKEEKKNNVALPASLDENDFVNWREKRDQALAAPKLLFQSVQVNVDAGRLPKPSSNNEIRYLKIPINAFRPNVDKDSLTYDSVAKA
jgi:glyoxylase-like metal-dependent hydrolase (beta-lactamase superfamily II)